ncbi:hypothetical protein VTP01DRAFT_6404 [Rhizomucor pusillus]|uniref:uncharacterized protein n=1 Tax=Rhizomucor pusillus TaxID=4840 RepID=UPI003743F731
MEFKDNNLDNVYFDEKNRAYVKQDIGREPNSATVAHAQPRSTAASEQVIDVVDKRKEERNKIDNPVTHINKDDKRGVIGKPNKDWQ